MGHVQSMTEKRNSYKALVGKPKPRRSHTRPSHCCKDNTIMDLTEIRLESVD
jgi:hypothetical protein